MIPTLLQLARTSRVVRRLNDLNMFDEIRIVRTPKGFTSTIQIRYCGITAQKSLVMANDIANVVRRQQRHVRKKNVYASQFGSGAQTRAAESVPEIYAQRNDCRALRTYIR